MLLAGDIGGTKTDLGIFSNEAGPHAPLFQAEVHSADYPSLQALAQEFLTKANMSVDRACFDVAGPVIDGRVKTTNLPWVMDEISLAKDLNLRSVHLMNDLEAVARAIPILRTSDVRTLNVGRPVAKGAIGVIAPGTGLGESFLTWDGSSYVAHSSEGGHADFAPTDERQLGLLRRMLKRFDHVSVEHVCSGIGIPNIYEYLRDIEHVPETPEVARLIVSAKDPSAVIIASAVDPHNPSELCAAAQRPISALNDRIGDCSVTAVREANRCGRSPSELTALRAACARHRGTFCFFQAGISCRRWPCAGLESNR
jgi:glucokinase